MRIWAVRFIRIILFVPLLFGGFSSFSLWAKATSGFVVVLDAGHGGHDPGAVGAGGREKDITLSVVRKLGEMIKQAHPEVKVLYTRSKDVFVGLQARADFANKHKASLFISVHVNSASPSAFGTETYVLGLGKQSNNFSAAIRENKAMLLEKDYKTTYKGFDPTSVESYIMFDLMQESYLARSIDFANLVQKQYRKIGRSSRGVRQDVFWVLSQSAMPSVLTEIGFISNSSEARYILSDAGQREIAQALARAFSTFYTGRNTPDVALAAAAAEVDESVEAEQEQESTSPIRGKKSTTQAQTSQGKVRYRVQLMSISKKLDPKGEEFKGLKQQVTRTRLGSVYVYMVGNTSSLEEAKRLRQQVLKYYKDAFVVKYEGERRIGRI